LGVDANGEYVDAPDAPDYDEAPEEGLDLGLVDRNAWRSWPLWAKLRFLRRLRTEGSGRPDQYIDDTLPWYLWELLGGRGSGKTLESAGWSAEDAERLAGIRTALVARTFGDVRDTMFEGETGLLSILPDYALKGGSRDRAYNRSLGELFMANGSRFKGFSSEKPAQLRGPQHHRAWLDESSSWDDADVPNLAKKDGTLAPAVDTTMSNLMLGLRLKAPDGSGVRMVCATTPKPNELTYLLEDLAQRRGVARVLSTYSNLDNLSEEFKDVVFGMYEGTDAAAQELEGKILRQAKGAAWDLSAVGEAKGRGPFGEPAKAVLGIDPAVSSKDTSDETGLVVVVLETREVETAKGPETQKGICVSADLSGKVEVQRFGATVVGAVEAHGVDVAVVEVNNGYDFVVNAVTSHVEAEGGTVVRRVRKDARSPRTKARVVVEYICETASGHAFVLKPVWQSVDKLTRAKAASVWWHQGWARHEEGLETLEKQMTTYEGSGKKSPDRLDGLTSAVAELSGERRLRSARGASPLDLDEGGPPPGGPLHALLGGDGPTPELDPASPGRGGQSTWAARL
jgi:phage terminase large subunit-like protein